MHSYHSSVLAWWPSLEAKFKMFSSYFIPPFRSIPSVLVHRLYSYWKDHDSFTLSFSFFLSCWQKLKLCITLYTVWDSGKRDLAVSLFRCFSQWQYVLFVLTAILPVRVSTENTDRKLWRCFIVQLSLKFGIIPSFREGYERIKKGQTWVSLLYLC